MLLLLACAPKETNDPPEIVTTNFLDGSTVEVPLKTGLSIYVIAEDTDGDELTFTWELSEDGPVEGYALVGQDGSQLDLAWDDGLAGQTLTCTVSDGQASTSISWLLDVEDVEDAG